MSCKTATCLQMSLHNELFTCGTAWTVCSLCQDSSRYSFFPPVFWWCFILNHLIKLTRNLWVGFGSLLLTCQTLLCLNERALILSRSMFFPFPLGGSLGQVVAVSLSAVLILPSDFTRSPEKMKMAAVIPGTLLERYTANMGVLVLNLKWGHAFVLNVSQFALITINFFYCMTLHFEGMSSTVEWYNWEICWWEDVEAPRFVPETDFIFLNWLFCPTSCPKPKEHEFNII